MRLLFLALVSFSTHAQISYSGFLGKMPIKIIIHTGYGRQVSAVYEYEKYDTPIVIDGIQQKSKLELYERNSDHSIGATLRFKNFSEASKNLQGEWLNRDSTKILPITINRDFQVDAGTEKRWEIMQRPSLPEHYFRMIVTKNEYGDLGVTGVKIFEKKTDRLVQVIDGLDCQYIGLDNLEVADYNFDGVPDFSIFETSYAGANTSSIYILRSPESEKYYISNIRGISLSFDANSKTILEHNEDRGGTGYADTVYKLENSEMKPISKKCFEYNEQKQKHDEVACR